jgi:hypothetical protein
MMKNKKYTIGVFLFCLCIFSIIAFGTYQDWELQNNGVFTVGKLTDVSYDRRGKYHLHYEYFVNGKKYKDKTVTHYFNCINDKKCIGNEYKVIYSSKNPSNSDIELGELKKYKASIPFFKIDWNNSSE